MRQAAALRLISDYSSVLWAWSTMLVARLKRKIPLKDIPVGFFFLSYAFQFRFQGMA
jgi:hypothetical protein